MSRGKMQGHLAVNTIKRTWTQGVTSTICGRQIFTKARSDDHVLIFDWAFESAYMARSHTSICAWDLKSMTNFQTCSYHWHLNSFASGGCRLDGQGHFLLSRCPILDPISIQPPDLHAMTLDTTLQAIFRCHHALFNAEHRLLSLQVCPTMLFGRDYFAKGGFSGFERQRTNLQSWHNMPSDLGSDLSLTFDMFVT